MDGQLWNSNGEVFTTGVTGFRIGNPRTSSADKVLINIAVEGQATIAAVDTGGHYLVCDPGLAELIAERLTDHEGNTVVSIRGRRISGDLYRCQLEFRATAGVGCVIDATAFIPHPNPDEPWDLPTFIGWTGVLERMVIAIDPSRDQFHFGPLP